MPAVKDHHLLTLTRPPLPSHQRLNSSLHDACRNPSSSHELRTCFDSRRPGSPWPRTDLYARDHFDRLRACDFDFEDYLAARDLDDFYEIRLTARARQGRVLLPSATKGAEDPRVEVRGTAGTTVRTAVSSHSTTVMEIHEIALELWQW